MTVCNTVFILLLISSLGAQTSFCPDDPPINPWLADSPYPIYHRNSYAQASTCLSGPGPEDRLRVKVRTDITGGTSPWIYFSETYPNGERTILYSNSTHVFKFMDDGETLIAIDSFRLDFNTIASNGYNHLLTKNRIWFSYEPTYDPQDNRYSRIFKFTDADPNDPTSEIVLLSTFNFGDYGINRVNMYNLNYDGDIVWYSEKNPTTEIAYAGIIDQDFNLLDTLSFKALPEERINHNSIAVDENNSFYIVTSHRLIQFAWDGTELVIGWEARYDFVNDGPTGNFAYGSGTTPTLMGWGEGNDKLVIVADGHAQNNLIAFWRELPDDWSAVDGQNIHFADKIEIPFATTFGNLFQSIENSPTVYGYEVAIAQFNGFLGYDCDNIKGVQKFRWNTDRNSFELAWATDAINVNGVLSYSSGSNLVYGVGKESDCNYYYYGLDWDNGDLMLRFLLGPEGDFPQDRFYDQGVNHIIDENGNIYYSGSRSLVKIERDNNITHTSEFESSEIYIYPNPVTDVLYFGHSTSIIESLQIYDVTGKLLYTEDHVSDGINIQFLKSGLYILKLRTPDGNQFVKFLKN